MGGREGGGSERKQREGGGCNNERGEMSGVQRKGKNNRKPQIEISSEPKDPHTQRLFADPQKVPPFLPFVEVETSSTVQLSERIFLAWRHWQERGVPASSQ